MRLLLSGNSSKPKIKWISRWFGERYDLMIDNTSRVSIITNKKVKFCTYICLHLSFDVIDHLCLFVEQMKNRRLCSARGKYRVTRGLVSWELGISKMESNKLTRFELNYASCFPNATLFIPEGIRISWIQNWKPIISFRSDDICLWFLTLFQCLDTFFFSSRTLLFIHLACLIEAYLWYRYEDIDFDSFTATFPFPHYCFIQF